MIPLRSPRGQEATTAAVVKIYPCGDHGDPVARRRRCLIRLKEEWWGRASKRRLVVSRESARGLKKVVDELPVREDRRELLVKVLGKQERTFLGTRCERGEPLTNKTVPSRSNVVNAAPKEGR